MAACVMSCYFAACSQALKVLSRPKLADLLETAGRGGQFELYQQRLADLQLITAALRTILNLVVLLMVLLHAEGHYGPLGEVRQWPIVWVYTVAFLIAGLLVSIFSVAIPVSWARYQPERLIAVSLPVLLFVSRLFRPFARLLHLFDPVVRRISGVDAEPDNNEDELTEEMLSIVDEHDTDGRFDDTQRRLIEAAVEFGSITAGEIVTPRTDVVGIEVDATLEQVRQTIIEKGFSRYPVYEGTIDHIVGVLYAKDLIRLVGQPTTAADDDGAGDGAGFDLRRLLREALLTPETKPVQALLAEFKARQVHIAIVLDEYGGTAGIITIEDVIEELVGDIQDEYERPETTPELRWIDDQTAEVDARMHVDDVNDALRIELPEDEDYDTVGGYVFSTLGHIPVVGESVECGRAKLTVIEAGRTKVNRLRIELPSPDEQGGNGAGNGAGSGAGNGAGHSPGNGPGNGGANAGQRRETS
jgi:putative hemolysin